MPEFKYDDRADFTYLGQQWIMSKSGRQITSPLLNSEKVVNLHTVCLGALGLNGTKENCFVAKGRQVAEDDPIKYRVVLQVTAQITPSIQLALLTEGLNGLMKMATDQVKKRIQEE